MKLSKRLQAIADLVPEGTKLIDVGCDHGLLGLYLLKKRKISKLILSDVSANALEYAKVNAKKYQLKSDFYITDGLNGINADLYDTIVIAGMGTDEIIKILTDVAKGKTLILSSHSYLFSLRHFMMKQGFKLIDEVCVMDRGKFYFIMKYEHGKQKLNFSELVLGVSDPNTAGFKAYKDMMYQKQKRVYNQIPWRYITKKLSYLKQLNVYKK